MDDEIRLTRREIEDILGSPLVPADLILKEKIRSKSHEAASLWPSFEVLEDLVTRDIVFRPTKEG